MLERNPYPLSIYFQSMWPSFKNLLKPICIKLPMYLDKALNQLIQTLFNVFKTTEIEVYVYSYVGKRHDFHMIETTEQKRHNFWAVGSFLLKQMSCRKIRVRLNFIEVVLHMFADCISARIVLLFQESFCLYGNSLWRSKVPVLKANAVEKTVNEAKTHKRMYCIFPSILSSLANILFLI